VNKQILRLSGVAMLLLAVLIVATTYWQTWARADLAAKQDNAIQRVAEFSIRRGTIETGGRLLAGNRRQVVNGKTLYFRRYPQGKLTAHVVGYSTASRARTGLEKSLNDYLTASNESLSTFVDRSLRELRGKPIRGNDVRLTLNLRGQKAALDALGTKCGAVVALDPRNGAVKVLASSPSYDPNLVERQYSLIGRIRADCSPAAPLIDRATAGLYAPGSTFKLVTVSAALSSGKFTPASTFHDPGYCEEYGKKVLNFADQSGPEVFGTIRLHDALVHSVNSVFCNIGKQLGAIPILRQAERFGFYRLPPLETPEEDRRPSGLYDAKRRPFFPKRESQVDPGRIAFGQERLLVTPLQMAMVAATIGNGGLEMEPFVVSRVVSPGGRTIVEARPHRLGRPVAPKVAQAVHDMMVDVVRRGTGTSAQIPGLLVGGKTGTAETGVSHRNTTWFVCFAGPNDGSAPSIAVAVVLEDQTGTGGATAAPIARQVIEALLPRGGNP
jgi:peptidoglycan glycosyltransferase